MNVKNILIFVLCYFSIYHLTYAEGLSLDKTRIVFHDNQKSNVIDVLNDDDKPYLIQTKIMDDIEGIQTSHFIATPPIFRLDNKSKSSIRIMLTEGERVFQQDKESIFYLNVRAIPSSRQNDETESNAKIRFISNILIKIIYRPKNIQKPTIDEFKKIKIIKNKYQYAFENKTPYYMTLVNIVINNERYGKNMLIPPFSDIEIDGAFSSINQASWQTINDYGGLSEVLYQQNNHLKK